ncbi:MAG: hypothetical protein JW878_02605 [Methanomicrobia archaeon]|nr:hypothetical protein [Methanomicrobia archaeon]
MKQQRRTLRKDKKGFTGLEAAIVLTAFVVVAAVFSYVVLNAGFFTSEKSKEVVHTGVEQVTTSCELAGNVIGHGWEYNASQSSGNITMATYDADGEHYRDKTGLCTGADVSALIAEIDGTANNYTISVTTDATTNATKTFTLDGADDSAVVTTNLAGLTRITGITRTSGTTSDGATITIKATCNGTYYWDQNGYDNFYDSTNMSSLTLYLTLTAGQSPIDMDMLTISYSDQDTYVGQLPYSEETNASMGNMPMGAWTYTTQDTPGAVDNNMLEPREQVCVLITLPDYGVTVNKQFTVELKPSVGATVKISRITPGQVDKTMVLY